GINFRTGGALHVEQCRINGNFVLVRGIGVDRSACTLFVNETTIRNSAAGIVFDARTAVIDASQFEDNAGNGFIAEAGDSRVTITQTISAGNSFGFIGEGELNLERCVAANNSTAGIQAGIDAVVRVSNSTVTNNLIGLSAPTNSQLLSRGNNTVEG